MRIKCKGCGKTLKAPDSAAGKVLKMIGVCIAAQIGWAVVVTILRSAVEGR